MRRTSIILTILLSLLWAPDLWALGKLYGWAEQGGHTVSVTGVGESSNSFQRSYPQATITIYDAGTLDLSTIYEDSGGITPLANPFTASTAGYWEFYAADANYDVRTSGGGLASPYTLSNLFISTAGATAAHTIISPAVHTDTFAGTLAEGDLLVGNSTPKWARFADGTANQLLTTDTSGAGLEWKTLTAGTGISVTPVAGTVTIAATGTGTDNTASNENVGGVGVFDLKDGDNLEFRGIKSEDVAIVVALDAPNNEIDLTLDEGQIDHGAVADLTADDHTQYLELDGTDTMTGNLQMGANDITITAASLIDGRDVSVDGTKLDTVETSADVTDATNVAAATAVMDGDFAGSTIGEMARTGAGAYVVMKHNLTATAPPTVNDDTTLSYVVGSRWFDITNDLAYVATEVGAGAADWKEITSSGTGTVTSVAMTVPGDLSIAGTPVTTTGTLAVTRDNQAANEALMGPTGGGPTTPAYRALVAADIPSLDTGKLTTGTLVHERGGLEADVSAYTGIPLITGGATSNIPYNMSAAASPAVTDDTPTYVVGSIWHDTTNDEVWICIDNTLNNAVWIQVNPDGEYADMSVEGSATATTIAGAGTFAQVTQFDTDGNEQGADADNTADTITVGSTGIYYVWYAVTMSGAGGDEIAFQVEKNTGATEFLNTRITRKVGAGGDVGAAGAGGLLSLTAADTVELWVTNETDTSSVTIEDAVLGMFLVPGVGPAAGAGGGEANTASCAGAAHVGVCVFDQKNALELEFKELNAGSSKISITDDGPNVEIDIDVVEANLVLNNISGTLDETKGGTGNTSYNLGDTLYASGANTLTALAGNTTAAKQFFTMTGTGAAAQAPVWAAIIAGDLPTHASTHDPDGSDTLTTATAASLGNAAAEGVATSVARSDHVHKRDARVRKNSGADVGTRNRLNFIEGSNVTLTIADDAGNDEVDITIAASAASGYDTVKEDGAAQTQRTTMDFIGAGITASDDGAETEVTLDADLHALAGLASTGLVARTGAATYSERTITGTAFTIGLTNGDGVAGNPTLDILYTADPDSNPALGAKEVVFSSTEAAGGLLFEGTTADTNEGMLVWNPTTDKTITLPDETMTVAGRDVTNAFTAIQSIDSGTNAVQLTIQANAAATASLLTLENSAATDLQTSILKAGTGAADSKIQTTTEGSYGADLHDEGNEAGATTTVNFQDSNVIKLVLTGTSTTFNLNGMEDGFRYLLRIENGASWAVSGWASDSGTLHWPGGTAPTITTGAGAWDVISCVDLGTDIACAATQDFQ